MLERIKAKLRGKSRREIIKKIDMDYGLGRLERLLTSNWLNPFATLWVNLRCVKLKHAWKMPVLVYGRPKLGCLSGSIEVMGKASPGMLKFNLRLEGRPNLMTAQSELFNAGRIIIGKGVEIGTGTKITIATTGVFTIGYGTHITDFVNIACFKSISIGDNCSLVHRTQFMDSNFHYLANWRKRTIAPIAKPIVIGSHVWVCNSSTVTGGAVIPDDTIVASNSLVNKDFSDIEPYSLIGGCPAKFITSGMQRVWNPALNEMLYTYFESNPDTLYALSDELAPNDLY